MKKLMMTTALLVSTWGYAAGISVDMVTVKGQGKGNTVGNIDFEDSKYGLLIKPHLTGLPQGLHGLHVHVGSECGAEGAAAGGHLDPEKTDKHLGPYREHGHLGDLPALYVDAKGVANTETLAPRLHIGDIFHHTLMIHAQGDNYSDEPAKLGGGGDRIICGAIE